MDEWWLRKEKAGKKLLKLTLFIVKFTPPFFIKISIFFVTFFYFVFSPVERKNIREFRKNVKDYSKKNISLNTYSNFYHFGESLCNKISIWIKKYNKDDMKVINEEVIAKELINSKKGQILLVSHFGDVEIARGLTSYIEGLNIVRIYYAGSSPTFTEMIDGLSKHKMEEVEIDSNMSSMLKLRSIIKEGRHIALMGDRIPIHGDKFEVVDFLGKPCAFPKGAYLLAGLLNASVGSLWCEKINGKYNIEYKKITDIVEIDRQRNVETYVKTYVSQLEEKVCKYPELWFNFFNFWKLDDK